MNHITFSNELRKQYRDPTAYLEQVGNVLFGLFRVLGWWVFITTTYASAAAIYSFIIHDLSNYSQSDLQEGFRVIVTFSGIVAAVACLLGNLGRFRDVFSARALEQVERFRDAKEKVESQIETTEVLLVKYGLITETDIEHRRGEALKQENGDRG